MMEDWLVGCLSISSIAEVMLAMISTIYTQAVRKRGFLDGTEVVIESWEEISSTRRVGVG